MGIERIWRNRLRLVTSKITALLWIITIYLFSELLIWSVSLPLGNASLQYFASCVGMVSVFAFTMVTQILWGGFGVLYTTQIKSKVDFINSHLGLGFPIPIVMLDQNEVLDTPDIGRVIANFVITNLIFWPGVFALSLLAISGTSYLKRISCQARRTKIRKPRVAPPRLALSWHSDSSLDTISDRFQEKGSERSGFNSPNSETYLIESSILTSHIPASKVPETPTWTFLCITYPLLLSLFAVFAVGIPVSVTTGHNGILDASILWLAWMSSVRLQQRCRTSNPTSNKQLNSTIGTLLNPVLLTTLLMTAYTRARASASPGIDLSSVLSKFSFGTPLYSIWTTAVTGKSLPHNPDLQFGAGDAALSILECGIVIWGFKLYECRRQVFSKAGAIAVLVSTVSAAANVFACVFLGRAIGLRQSEALAFAARSTTLALAKPAMEAISGNLAVNAAMVVSNGILGQLLYPFTLMRLGIDETPATENSTKSVGNTWWPTLPYGSRGSAQRSSDVSSRSSTVSDDDDGEEEDDSPTTIAVGISVGINGAAMGVAYLYEAKSRAAPYAALSMTVFGVMTVVFTTVDPFKGMLLALASR